MQKIDIQILFKGIYMLNVECIFYGVIRYGDKNYNG